MFSSIPGAPEGTLPAEKVVCSWCQNSGPKLFTLKTSSGTKAFCSEVCFTQCRRASFKKNKVCDWCKHVRHTVNYVDFQDGEQQLQFCSAKCLNQYKMSIFCRETQEHLKQIRSPSDMKKPKHDNDEQILITPELWLKEGKLDAIQKESKQSSTEKEFNIKNRIPKIEKHDNDVICREKSAMISKSYVDRMSRDKNRRSTPKDNKTDTPSPNGLQEIQNSSNQQAITPVAQGNIPAISQLIPSQLWSMFAPGMPQFGGVPPWFYPGFMPPVNVNGFLPPGFPLESLQRSPNDGISQNIHPPPVPPVISEDSMQDAHDRSKRKSTTGGRQRSSPLHSAAKVNNTAKPDSVKHDFGNYQDMHMNFQQRNGTQQGSGMPPLTMIMPVPIALPFPVPIPLPLPLTMEKIMEVFGKTRSTETNRKDKFAEFDKTVKRETDSLNVSLSSDGVDSSISSYGYQQLPQKAKNDINENETIPADRLSCNSCITEQSISPNSGSDRSSPHFNSHLSSSYDFSLMRKRRLSPDGSLDLSKKSRIAIVSNNSSNSCDGAIDLSKDSNIGKLKCHFGKENRDTNDASSVQSDSEIQTGDTKEPKIHIVTPRDDPPLSQQLPLPPVDHKYSNRRGLILDAPYNPRRSRSPSPERRPYMARDYRGDRGRRRLLGIRNIKTK